MVKNLMKKLKNWIMAFFEQEVEWNVMTIRKEARLPFQANPGDAGLDLFSAEEAMVDPGCVCLVSTGLVGEIQEGFEIQIRPRSGLATKSYITVVNTPGTVDASYRGEIKVALINLGRNPYRVLVGDRIAQAVIQRLPKVKLKEVQSVTKSMRGTGGFGSSGK